jgi:hypothetical protein
LLVAGLSQTPDRAICRRRNRATEGVSYTLGDDGNLYQQWYLYPLGNHSYAVANVRSGLLLFDPNTSSANGTFVEESQWADTLN